MSVRETVYEAAILAARPALWAVAAFRPKFRRAVRGRREGLARLERWGLESRDGRPVVWLHAPSAGEALMAKAIMESLRERGPALQLVFTHFSPSAERLLDSLGADVTAFMPWDLRRPVRRSLDVVRPAAMAFVRTEVWPVLSRESHRRGIPQLLVNAVLAPTSSRLHGPGHFLLEPVYRRLAAVGAVATDHAERYRTFGLPPGRVRVTGDARFDQVWRDLESSGVGAWRRARRGTVAGAAAEPATAGDTAGSAATEDHALLDRLSRDGASLLVAGSTWPSDERVLVPAVAAVMADAAERRPRLVIAPHEPTPEHCADLAERLAGADIDHVRLSALETGSAPAGAVIVDRLGVLARLYAAADVAYVGGGFRSQGVHSVVEPATLGVPVLFGPGHDNAREAGELAEAGGGFVVADTAELRSRLAALLEPGAAGGPGAAAHAYVRAQLGGAARNADLILEHLPVAVS